MIRKLKPALDNCYIEDLKQLISFCDVVITKDLKRKQDYVNLSLQLLQNQNIVDKIIAKFNKSEQSTKLYKDLIWLDNYIKTPLANRLYGLDLKEKSVAPYRPIKESLSDNFPFLVRVIEADWRSQSDIVYLSYNLQKVLMLFYPKPKDYEMLEVDKPQETKYIYNNEQGVLDFINTIEGMLKNNLVEFGKTNEKPLLKSLNMLKSTTALNEFYTEKKLNNLATDMLTRSFSYYYWQCRKFESKEQDTLRHHFVKQFNDDTLDFFITRIFGSYLKKIRFDSYYTSQDKLFDIVMTLLSNIAQKRCVSVENIIHFCKYRDLYFYLETPEKTDEYILQTENDNIRVEEDYDALFFEPFIKASLFYLGALGILELRYDDPVSLHEDFKAKGEEYISAWDGLKYVSITKLGLYAMGKSDKYEAVVNKKKSTSLKFDIYKPIISVDSSDIITIAKLEPFCDKLDGGRYILSYSKIFKDCKNAKALYLKIDNFYKIFNQKPPKVFDDFFAEIKENANLLKRDLKLITIELKNNKKLLNLFMTNKKIQKLIIKASGYRVLVEKADIAKLTKIVKDNGFFVEF